MTLTEMAQTIEAQRAASKDYIVDTAALNMTDGENNLVVDADIGLVDSFRVTDTCHSQIRSRLKIPAKYYDRMRQEAPALLAANVNTWFAEEPTKRMIRTMDTNARAFLSDRYHRIDNWHVAEAALPALMDVPSLEIKSCQVTEKKLYIKATLPTLRQEVKVGDVVEAGIQITNSEIGFGRYVVEPFLYRLICLNGMRFPDKGLTRRHVGARTDIGDEVYAMLSDEALKADDQALMLKTRDVVKGILSETSFIPLVDKLRETTEQKIEGNPTKAVEVLGDSLGLTDGEQGGVLRHLIEGGDLSRWGVANAVTRFAQDVPDYDRDDELQLAGGKIIDLPKSDWEQIAIAA
jgi:hypothetical protein